MFYDDIKKNKRKSWFIISFFGVIIGLIVYAVLKVLNYGTVAVIYAAPVAVISTFLTYWNSDKLVLASVKARKPNADEKYLQNIIDGLLIAAGESISPKLYIMDSEQLNAFATGRNPQNSVICVTTGLMKTLNRQEMESVLAHELTHILNYDIKLSCVTSAMAGFIVILADFVVNHIFWLSEKSDDNRAGIISFVAVIVLLIVSPIVAKFIQLAISRKREILADAGSVALTRDPDSLISALESISTDKHELGMGTGATASMFTADPNPEVRKVAGKSSWWSTHPTLEERVEAIRKLQ